MAVWGSKERKGPAREVQVSGTMRKVEFSLFAPDAKRVFVAGSFNDWNTEGHPLKKSSDGTWRTRVDLPVGRHEYKFFIDGAWAQNTPCAEITPNVFGTHNCAIVVS